MPIHLNSQRRATDACNTNDTSSLLRPTYSSEYSNFNQTLCAPCCLSANMEASSSKSRASWAPSWLSIGSPSGKYQQLPTTTPPTPQLDSDSDREVALRVARRRRVLPPIICVALLLAAVGLSFGVSSTRDIVTAGLEEVETEITGHRLDVQAGLPAAKLKGEGQVGSGTGVGVVATGGKGAGATGSASATMGAATATATVTGHKDMWGLSEDDGWRSTKQGLSDLGMLGEKAYHLDLASGEAGIIQ
jgi:hypothetical protein